MNGKRNGNGVYFYSNGSREIGDYKDNIPVGTHARLNVDGEVETVNY